MNELELTGRSRTHIVQLDSPACGLHYEAITSFLVMRDAAAQANIDLGVRSSYRDFATQLSIWNAKWRGERPLLGRDGAPLDRSQLSDNEALDAILAWSAIPGGSRHHWGSDLDVIDLAAMPPDHKVALTPDEFAPTGLFSRLTAWLDENMASFGFFRPYAIDRGGVCIEPWHISYAPVSLSALEGLSLSMLRQSLAESELEGKMQVMARLPEIYTRYLLAVDLP